MSIVTSQPPSLANLSVPRLAYVSGKARLIEDMQEFRRRVVECLVRYTLDKLSTKTRKNSRAWELARRLDDRRSGGLPKLDDQHNAILTWANATLDIEFINAVPHHHDRTLLEVTVSNSAWRRVINQLEVDGHLQCHPYGWEVKAYLNGDDLEFIPEPQIEALLDLKDLEALDAAQRACWPAAHTYLNLIRP